MEEFDLNTAFDFFHEAGKERDELWDEIEFHCKDCLVSLNDIDPCYVAWDVVLQEAIGILNEHNISTLDNAETYGNCIDTFYKIPDYLRNELKEILLELPERQKNELKNNKVVMKVLEELEIYL